MQDHLSYSGKASWLSPESSFSYHICHSEQGANTDSILMSTSGSFFTSNVLKCYFALNAHSPIFYGFYIFMVFWTKCNHNSIRKKESGVVLAFGKNLINFMIVKSIFSVIQDLLFQSTVSASASSYFSRHGDLAWKYLYMALTRYLVYKYFSLLQNTFCNLMSFRHILLAVSIANFPTECPHTCMCGKWAVAEWRHQKALFESHSEPTSSICLPAMVSQKSPMHHGSRW